MPIKVTSGGISATSTALDLIREIQQDHPDILFHQSGGCCDGSSPMCYPKDDFIVGDRDVLPGHIGGVPFYMSGSQYEAWKKHRAADRRRTRSRRHVLARKRPGEAVPGQVECLCRAVMSH